MPAKGGRAILSVREADKAGVVDVAKTLQKLGFELLATRGTAAVLEAANIPVKAVNKVSEGRPHIVDMLKNDEVDYVVNTTEGRKAIADSSTIRRTALQHKVPYTTTLAAAKAVCMALEYGDEINVRRLQEIHSGVNA